MAERTMSIQEEKWRAFSEKVATHIREYVIPQYGDEDVELAKGWTVEDCIKQAQTYQARYGKANRKGEEILDFLKAVHWLQKAADRLTPQAPHVELRRPICIWDKETADLYRSYPVEIQDAWDAYANKAAADWDREFGTIDKHIAVLHQWSPALTFQAWLKQREENVNS